MVKITKFIASLFFSGFLPKMPGTWGSMLTAVFIFFFYPRDLKFQFFLLLAVFLVSVVASGKAREISGVEDPEWVVIDGAVGMLAVFLGLPARENLLLVVCGLIIFRIIDIIKFPPVSTVEKLPGGFGITVDDLVAGLITNVLLRFFWG